MNACEKLNRHYVLGCLAASGAFGLLCQSWGVFFLMLVGGLIASVLGRDIRPTRVK